MQQNLMFIQKNCFQRQTDLLSGAEVRSQISSIYRISSLISTHEYEAALEEIDKYQKTFEFQQDNLYFQFGLMRAFCCFRIKDLQRTKQICKEIYEQLDEEQRQLKQRDMSLTTLTGQLKRSFSVRFYTFVIVLIIEGYNMGIQHKVLLQKLIEMLRIDQLIYLPEVLGTMTGCRSFKNVHKVTYLNGQENKKMAKKLQILAVWKYLMRQENECIEFKKQALNIWKNQNLLKEKQKCEEELNQLLDYQQDPNVRGKFVRKLKRMIFFANELIALQKQAQRMPKRQINLKFIFPKLLDELHEQNQQKKVENVSLSQSNFIRVNDKKSQLDSVTSKCQQFYGNYKKQLHNQVTSLILNSKFMDQQTIKIRPKLLIFFKLRKHILETTFPKIKECAIIRFQRLAKSKK